MGIRKKGFHNEGCETPAQVAQTGGGCSSDGDTQGQAGGALSPDGAVAASAHCRGGWIRWALRVPSNTNHSMILQFPGVKHQEWPKWGALDRLSDLAVVCT